MLATLLVASLTGALISALGKDTKTIHPRFSVGALDENGYYVENDQSIYTKKAFEAVGLRVEPDFESNVTYDIYFYDYAERLIEAKTGLTRVFNEDVELAQYARIVIHPEIPEDISEDEFKIKWYQITGYANKLKITVDRKQEELIDRDDKDYGPNLFDASKSTENSSISTAIGSEIELVLYEPGMYPDTSCSEKIVLDSSYEHVDIVFRYTGSNPKIFCAIISELNIVLNSDHCSSGSEYLDSVEEGDLVTLSFDIAEYQKLYSEVSMYVSYSDSINELFVFGY